MSTIEILDVDFDAHRDGWDVIYAQVDDDGNEGEDHAGFVAAAYEVCGTCRGKGTHVNPAIDGQGITESDWADWDPDERAGYFRGDYDVTCDGCKGQRVVAIVELPRPHGQPDPLATALAGYFRDVAASRVESDRERMWEHRMLYGCD